MDLASELKCNDSILNLLKEDLQSELIKWRSSCKEYLQIIEDKNQEVYVLKRQINLLKTQELEYQREIEDISSTESKKHKILEDRIKKLQAPLSSRCSVNESEDIKRLQNECETLRKTLAEAEMKHAIARPSIHENKFHALVAENEDLKSKYDFTYSKYASAMVEIQQSNDEMKRLAVELDETRRTYACNTTDTRAKLDEQEEHIAMLRVELSNAQVVQQNKEEQSHESRGNSMFSEVYDNWIRLKRKNDSLVVAYQEARQERNKLRSEVTALRRENASMCSTWNTESIVATQYDTDLISTYKYCNEKLEDLVTKYEEELAKERTINNSTSSKNNSVYMNMIKSKNEQIDKLYKEFRQANGFSITHRLEIREVNNKARKYLSEATQFKNKAELLQDQLNALKETNNNCDDKNDIDGVDNDGSGPSSTSADNFKFNGNNVYGKVECICQFRKPFCDAATMTEYRLPHSRMFAQPFNGILRTEKHSEGMNIQKSETSINENTQIAIDSSRLDDSTKENDLTISNILSVNKTETRKVQFADSVPASPFVNQPRRRPRPRGKPGDSSQMIVVRRQSPKKL